MFQRPLAAPGTRLPWIDVFLRWPTLPLMVLTLGALLIEVPLSMRTRTLTVLAEILIAAAVLLVVALATTVLAPSWVGIVTPLGAIALIALARDLTGAGTSGLVPLLLIPIIWLAVYGTVWEAVIGLVGSALALTLPPLIIGQPDYQFETEMLRSISFGVVAVTLVALSIWARTELLTDPLTRIGNRRSWDRDLDREMARAARAGESLVVALADLDLFKQYNDRYGHLAGDRHLVQCAREWREALRREDVIVRAGGEEFFLLLPRTTAEEAERVLGRVRSRTPNGQTCSLGYAVWDTSEDAGKVLHRADEALYRAKAAGRNRIFAAPPPPPSRHTQPSR